MGFLPAALEMQAFCPSSMHPFSPFSKGNRRENMEFSDTTCNCMKKGRIILVRWRRSLFKEYQIRSLIIPARTKEMLVYLLRPHRLVKTTVHLSSPKSTSYPRVRELCEDSEHDGPPASQNLICHHMLIRSLLRPLCTVRISESVEWVRSGYDFLVLNGSSHSGFIYSVVSELYYVVWLYLF